MITNENEILSFFSDRFEKEGNVGWGSTPEFAWLSQKQQALESIAKPEYRVLDLGCGDFGVIKDVLQRIPMDYIGIDGSQYLIDHNKEKYGQSANIDFMVKPFSELIKEKVEKDIIIAFDVLFHIIEDKLYKDLIKWIFSQNSKYILMTYHEVEEKTQSYEHGHFIPRPIKLKQKGYKIIFETHFKDRDDLKLVVYEKTS